MFEHEDKRKYWVILCPHTQAMRIAEYLRGRKDIEITLFDKDNLVLYSVPEIKDLILKKLGKEGLEIPSFNTKTDAITYMKNNF